MRIRRIQIVRWRHFRNIEINLGPDAGLVCLVGSNGTGKSQLLELIAACAHRLGLAPGLEAPRGDPFGDEHEFSLEFFVASSASVALEAALAGYDLALQWDRTLTLKSQLGGAGGVWAGGFADDPRSQQLATWIIAQLKDSKAVHFLHLDADRAYPRKNPNVSEVAQAYEIDWAGPEYMRGRSYRSSATLYDEWLKYFLASENQAGTNLTKAIRMARLAGHADPTFEDHFVPYKNALKTVLPHITFTGVDSKARTLQFDTTGLQLSFNQLSGGEREIAFLVGQIDRFGLTQGLFLVDEPELHLNADLVRGWVEYLASTISKGQIWLATHSLEAVESAGQSATFLLERNDATRQVETCARLDSRPVLTSLSRAVGSPAFSISQLLFVFVEGETDLGERERYRRLAGNPNDVRFMEVGACTEVIRRVATVRTLESEAERGLRIGGIVDRDFRSAAEVAKLRADHNVFALDVHEVENFFLEPATLATLLRRHGIDGVEPAALVREAADARAGTWIFQKTMSSRNAEAFPEIGPVAKDRAKRATWNEFQGEAGNALVASIAAATGFDENAQLNFRNVMGVCVRAYGEKRVLNDFWKQCEGKQVLNAVAQALRFADAAALIQAAFSAWSTGEIAVPAEVMAMRQYLADQRLG